MALAQARSCWGAALQRLQQIGHVVRATVARAAGTLLVTASALTAFGIVAGLTDFFVGNVVVSMTAGAFAENTIKDGMLRNDDTKTGAL